MWMRLDGSYGGQYIWKKKISHKCCLSTAPGKLGDVNQIQIFFHLSSTGTHSIDWSIDWPPLPPFPNQPTNPPSPSTPAGFSFNSGLGAQLCFSGDNCCKHWVEWVVLCLWVFMDLCVCICISVCMHVGVGGSCVFFVVPPWGTLCHSIRIKPVT